MEGPLREMGTDVPRHAISIDTVVTSSKVNYLVYGVNTFLSPGITRHLPPTTNGLETTRF